MFFSPFHRAPEAERLRPGFDDVGAIRDAVQERFAQPRIGKHSRPFREWKIGSHNDRCALGSLRDHLKQKLRTDVGQRYITLSFAKNASADMSLRGNAFITVMQTAELRDLDDPADTGDLPRNRTMLVEAQNGSSIRGSKRNTKPRFS
jgi:hypothetical protein